MLQLADDPSVALIFVASKLRTNADEVVGAIKQKLASFKGYVR